MIGPVLHAEWERNILRRRDEKLVGGSYYHCLGYRCIFPAADTGSVQFSAGYQFIDVLTGTAHKNGCFGKGEILLMLYLHHRLGNLKEVVLLHCSGSFGFCLTSLAAIPLHSALSLKGAAAKTAFLGHFHTALSFTRYTSFRYISEVVNRCKQQ